MAPGASPLPLLREPEGEDRGRSHQPLLALPGLQEHRPDSTQGRPPDSPGIDLSQYLGYYLQVKATFAWHTPLVGFCAVFSGTGGTGHADNGSATARDVTVFKLELNLMMTGNG
jgi:hypothetical protein